jgi:cytoskeleton protein RodZ
MTDSQNSAQQSASAPPPANSAGALLRQYREAKGLHISILAAALKVPSSKLVALEANRFEELPDLVFARALAMSVCRYLHVDSAAVLSMMPGQELVPAVEPLVTVSSGMQRPMPTSVGTSGYSRRISPQWLMFAAALVAVLVVWAGLGFPGRELPRSATTKTVTDVLPAPVSEPPSAAEPAANAPSTEPVATPATVVTPVQSGAVPAKPAVAAQ